MVGFIRPHLLIRTHATNEGKSYESEPNSYVRIDALLSHIVTRCCVGGCGNYSNFSIYLRKCILVESTIKLGILHCRNDICPNYVLLQLKSIPKHKTSTVANISYSTSNHLQYSIYSNSSAMPNADLPIQQYNLH